MKKLLPLLLLLLWCLPALAQEEAGVGYRIGREYCAAHCESGNLVLIAAGDAASAARCTGFLRALGETKIDYSIVAQIEAQGFWESLRAMLAVLRQDVPDGILCAYGAAGGNYWGLRVACLISGADTICCG